MATLNYNNTKVNKLYYQNTEVKKCYYQGVAVLDNSFPAPSSHTPGDVITWDNKNWLVCHYDSSKNQVYLIAKDIISMTEFNYSENSTYSGSRLASIASTYQKDNMSAEALSMCVDVTVPHDSIPYEYYDVTAKVFVPSRNQMLAEEHSEGFRWFTSNANRKATYNGSATIYWTSSPASYSQVVVVAANGGLSSYDSRNSYGFRPCVCVQL